MQAVQDREGTLTGARRELASAFRRAGIDAPELDARVLVGHALGLDHTSLAARADCPLSDRERDAIAALAARRLAREPVARILGSKEFWGLPLALNADTLVPRPETETVVEAALAAVGDTTRRLRIADLGTGSGALLLALLAELPAARGVGTDISAAALDCARANAERLGLADRAVFVACNYDAALHDTFDLVVANPPYVATGDIERLQPEVSRFEPRRALDGGADGLAAYRAIATGARRLLAPDGRLVLELGAGQVDDVTGIVVRAGLGPAGAPRVDLAGVPRALTVKALP
jgi:release factor glutamine methyltransferase